MKELQPRWQEATKELIQKLRNKGEDFTNYKALEMFAREGDWQAVEFSRVVASLEAWEINPKFKPKLQENLPNSTIKIIDSIKTLQENINLPKFDLIVVDAPMNTYGPKVKGTEYGNYSEHFTFLKDIGNIIDEKAILIINTNRKPFDYHKYPEWKKRRDEFYRYKNTGDIPMDFFVKFYKKFFKNIGFETKYCIDVVRVYHKEIDMVHYLAFKLVRT